MDWARLEVWLSRPEGQNGEWQQSLQALGTRVLVQPLLRIDPPDDDQEASRALRRAESADIIVVASSNAVAGMQRLVPDWCPQGHLVAVGNASAKAMRAHCHRRVSVPGRFDTEGMLALPIFDDVAGLHVVLMTGHDGRRTLENELLTRGAQVEKLPLYRRNGALIQAARLERLMRADVAVITSMGAWHTLMHQTDSRQRRQLAEMQLVGSSRNVVKQAAIDVSWSRRPVEIDRMDAQGLVATLCRLEWAREREKRCR